MDEKLYTTKEVAGILKTTPARVLAWFWSKRINPVSKAGGKNLWNKSQLDFMTRKYKPRKKRRSRKKTTKGKKEVYLTEYSQLKHGMKVKCKIEGKEVNDAKLSIDNDGSVYVCQNVKQGGLADHRVGYDYSWYVGDSGDNKRQWAKSVTELRTSGAIRQRGKKSRCLVVWEEDEDPMRIFDYEEDAIDFVKGLYLRSGVKTDSIRMYTLGEERKVELSISVVEG